MDTQERREIIARELRATALDILNGNSDTIKDCADSLSRLSRGGGEIDRLARRVAESEYYECDDCGTDFHREIERGGAECRDYARG